jgi:hypothetical protein
MTQDYSKRVISIGNVLKWIAYLFIGIMLYLIVEPTSIQAINPFLFAMFAGAAYVDGYIVDGIETLRNKGQRWELHFLPSLALLHFGTALIFLGGFYNPWPILVSGLVVFMIGFLLSVNQIDRALWHPK